MVFDPYLLQMAKIKKLVRARAHTRDFLQTKQFEDSLKTE